MTDPILDLVKGAWIPAFANILAYVNDGDREIGGDRVPCEIRMGWTGEDCGSVEVRENLTLGPATCAGAHGRVAFYPSQEGGEWLFTVDLNNGAQVAVGNTAAISV